MIVAHHVVFGAYGFWLPNDPRGSWSTYVGSLPIYQAGGPATTTSERRSLANRQHDAEQRRRVKRALARKPVRFTGIQARAIARGIGTYVAKSDHKVWACAIMRDHVHMVVAQRAMHVDQLVIQFKGAAIRQFNMEGVHPFSGQTNQRGTLPKCFVRGYWVSFLHADRVNEIIGYVESNPIKQGMRLQHWSFVTKPGAPQRSAARHG